MRKIVLLGLIFWGIPLFAKEYGGMGVRKDTFGNSVHYSVKMDIQDFETSKVVKTTYAHPDKKPYSIVLKLLVKKGGFLEILVPYTPTPGEGYYIDNCYHMKLPGDGKYEESWNFDQGRIEKWGSTTVNGQRIIWKESLQAVGEPLSPK